jgi:hypothetical protein
MIVELALISGVIALFSKKAPATPPPAASGKPSAPSADTVTLPGRWWANKAVDIPLKARRSLNADKVGIPRS